MTHIRLPHTDLDDERWIEAGSDAFALHCAAMVWCDRRLTNGRLPRVMASRVALAVDPERSTEAIAVLVAHGFWVEDGDVYVIVDYLEHAFPAEQVKRTRARWKADKDRRRQHDNGDHSLCKDPRFCPVRRAELASDSTHSSTVESTSGRSRLDQTRLNQTRPDVESGSGMAGDEAPPADAGHPAEEEPPASPWVPVGDCPHAPGGRDTHIAFPDRIRCKDCAKAEKAKAHAEALAAARAELEDAPSAVSGDAAS